jgi:hypothetical protein
MEPLIPLTSRTLALSRCTSRLMLACFTSLKEDSLTAMLTA